MDATYRGVPALVLGGSGFIGAWTARALHASGGVVTVAGRDPGRVARALGTAMADVRVILADLGSPAAVDQIIDAAAPAVVFNLAGYGVDRSERDPELMERLNARLVERLCARLASVPDHGWAGLRLVHAGSALEYGRVGGPIRETGAANPMTDYGRTKLQGTRALEACCRASGLRAVVARLFTVYGSGEHPDRLLPAIMQTARTRARLALTTGRQRRSFTYVEDVAAGLLRLGAGAAAPGAIVNLAADRLASVREFAETAARVLGIDAALLDFGALPDREDEMWHGDVDVTRLHALTAWSPPTSIADGVRRTWELSHVA